MKKIKMHIIETDGFHEGTIDINYVPVGTDYHAGWGLPIHHTKIISEKIAEVEVLEVGERVSVEVKRGTFQDEDGIVSGGKWVEKTGTVTNVWGKNDTDGFIKFDDGDRQSVSLIRGNDGYPGRNIQPVDDNCVIIPDEVLINIVYQKPESPSPYNQCREPYRRGIGQGFGDTEDGGE